MKVLHLFPRYLDHSSNWAYQLIKGVNYEQMTLAALIYLNSEYHIEDAKEIRPLLNLLPITDEKKWYQLIQKINLWTIKNRIKINKNKFDIMHAHFAPTACEYMQLSKQLNKKLVVSFYGYDYENLPYNKPHYLPLYEQLFQQATLVISEGPHGASILKRLGCPVNKIHIVPLGVPTHQAPLKKLFKKKNQLQLVQVANFKEKKGHEITLFAFKEALKTCPQMSLTMVGNGALKKQMQTLIKELSLQPYVRMIDLVEPKNLYNFLTNFDVLIQPSRTTIDFDIEGGAPIIILDAQACGLPIIATNHADIPNITLLNKTAMLSDENDIHSIANSIRKFYSMDETLYKQFSDDAMIYVNENFSTEKCSTVLEQSYQSLY